MDAIALASRLHRNHFRHGDDQTPYVSHLFSTAIMLSHIGLDEDTIIAGLMHDSIEDLPNYYYEDLLADCGEEVARLVAQVSEDHTLPYQEKKLKYLDQIRNGNHQVLAISLADKIHNASTYHTLPIEKRHKGHAYMYAEIIKIARDKIADDKQYEYLEPLIRQLEDCLQDIQLED